MKPRLLEMSAICALLAGIVSLPADGQILTALKIMRKNQPPKAAFDPRHVPAAPDYALNRNWASLPTKRDMADETPPGIVAGDQTKAPVDVFFVYPTVLMGGQEWNADVRDAALNQKIEETTLRGQASIFNACCAIYAPRYRQMTLGGYVKWSENSAKASELAYSDVARAFRQFLTWNRGRPFIIAGHSQGSRLLRLLIEREIDGKPLARRMVAAYLVGHWIEADWYKGLKDVRPCLRADDTGCVLTWSTFAQGRDGSAQRKTLGTTSKYKPETIRRAYTGINPLSWTTDGATAPASMNLGGWLHGAGALQPGLVSARYRDGAVYISPPGKAYTDFMIPFGNFHNVDYNLFYMNVRANVQTRVGAFWKH
jgi:hypothetical protein